MTLTVQALDRATGEVLATLPLQTDLEPSELSELRLSRLARRQIARRQLLNAAQAACARFQLTSAI